MVGRVTTVAFALAASACGSSGSGVEGLPDAGADAREDAGVQVDARTSVDAASDASVDGPPDAASIELIVPEELADDVTLARLADWRSLPVLGTGRYRQASSADPSPDDPAPQELLARGNRDMNNFLCRSADAVGSDTQVVPFRFELSDCPDAYVKGFVTARFEGSGVMSRLWMTTLSRFLGAPGDETFRLWVDDDPVPRIQMPLQRLFDGAASEIFARPFGVENTMHIAWNYPVAFDSKLVIAIDGLTENNLYYHQADVVLDATATKRVVPAAASSARGDARSTLETIDKTTARDVLGTFDGTLDPAQMLDALAMTGPATIHLVELRVATADLPVLADVQLSVFWNGDAQAAIDLPSSELFASAIAASDPDSHVISSRETGADTVLSLQLPMPFAARARWQLSSTAASSVDLSLTVLGESTVPSEPFGVLHVERNRTLGPNTEPTVPIADVTGKGRLVGVCGMLEGHAIEGLQGALPLNYLEGDETAVIDGELAVSGTGAEDYFNSSFYYITGPFSNTFAQTWDIRLNVPDTPPRGYVTTCRWHVLTDAVDFQQSLDFDLEVGPGHPEILDDFRTVAFLYR